MVNPAWLCRGGPRQLSVARGIHRWHVSLTHTDTIAVATVVAEGSVGESGGTTGMTR